MALKFLNKKGWHTGSLRNIENVWKAEQKHEAEQRKLEELRKQILEERERDEFRQLQQQAGIIPRQERLEFLYDSGLAVGKTSSDGFKAIETYPGSDTSASASTSASVSAPASGSAPSSSDAAVPGALFEDKPQSANDAWRKLHTDPLLMIRQREQEALARIKNNPVKMAMIRQSVESTKKKKRKKHDDEKHQKVKSKHKKHSSSKHHSESESDNDEDKEKRRKSKHRKEHRTDSDSDSEEREKKREVKNKKKAHFSDSESDSDGEQDRRKLSNKKERLDFDEDSKSRVRHHSHSRRDYVSEKRYSDRSKDSERSRGGYEKSKYEEHRSDYSNDKSFPKAKDDVRSHSLGDSKQNGLPPRHDSHQRRSRAPQLTEEERAARLREMQMDAEVHEEQRWKRLKKADEDDAREANQDGTSRGKSFLHSVRKSVFGAEKGGSSTIEESVRRRSFFSQGRTADEGNAFRR